MNWWQRLLERNRLERELDSELSYHYDRQVEDHVRAGMSEDDARREARAEFGGIDLLKEECRDARGTRWVDETVQDLRFAVRMLAKDRWFAAAAVIALALGIAVSTVVFTVANALVIRGLTIENADRVMYLGTEDATGRSGGVSYLDYVDWRAASRAFAGVAAFNDTMMTLSDPDRAPDRVFGTYLSSNAFHVLGAQPMLGRDFLPADDRAGAPAVVILGHGTWTGRYGGDARVVNRTIEINGAAATVIGVMPDGFRFPFNAELWQPLSQLPGLSDQKRDRRVLGAFGRLDDRASMAAARSELTTIAASLARDHRETNTDIRAAVMTFNERFNGRISDPIYVALFCAVGFLLFIACANVANLLLARSATRTREISMRLSLGATRSRIVRQLLVESLLLAMIAGVFALGLAAIGVRSLSATAEGLVKPYWIQFTMDWRVFVVLAAVCLGTAFAFGLAPALHSSKANASEVLKRAGPTFTDAGSRRWAGMLLTGELALTLTLLAGAALMSRSVLALHRADLVIDTRPLLAMRLTLPSQQYATSDQRRSFVARLEERLGTLRAIPSATIASTVPFTPTGPPRQLVIRGRPIDGGTAPRVSVVTVGARYFETLALQMRRGRTFTDLDGTPGHESVIVNERFAGMYFQGEDPLGHQISLIDSNSRDAGARPATVIGVSASVRQNMGAEANPVAYLPYRADPGPFIWLIVRTEEDRGTAVALLREEVRALDSGLPLFGIMTMDQVLTQTLWPRRAFSSMFLVVSFIALVLAAVGLYAVTAYSVMQRTQELGIRMALGAQAPQVCWLILQQTLWPLGIGSVLGTGGALGIGKLLQAWLVQTSPSDPRTLMATTVLLGSVCVAAALWPARRATRIDPLVALRYE